MNQYIEPIRAALVFFPFVALLITLPYMLVQYRKYGAILFLRTAIIYSFVLYLMCAYFLIILPMPDAETVREITSARIQPIPFLEATEWIRSIQVDWGNPATWYRLFWNRNFFQIAANVLMLMPLGIYARYYFGQTLRQTLLWAFLLSLFFELTQLSGVYGLYPRPYRLADVDDLITNTLGGLLGYAVAPLFMRVLPSPKRMEARAYRKGEQVSITRRAFAALLDFMVMLVAMGLIVWFYPAAAPTGQGARAMISWLFTCYALAIAAYFMLGEWLTGGRSVGKVLLHLRLVDRRNDSRPKLWQCVVRYTVLYLVVLPAPALVVLAITLGGENGYSVWLVLGCIALMMVHILFWFLLAVHVFTHENQLLHGKLSMTRNVSTLRHRYWHKWHASKKPQAALPEQSAKSPT